MMTLQRMDALRRCFLQTDAPTLSHLVSHQTHSLHCSHLYVIITSFFPERRNQLRKITRLIAAVFVAVMSAEASLSAYAQSDIISDNKLALCPSPICCDKQTEFFESLALRLPKRNVIDVPFISQKPNFPNGCEAVSAVMALNFMGVDVTPQDFVKSHLDMGNHPYIRNGKWYACDPREQFPGDPRLASGWGCYPEVIKKAVDSMGDTSVEATVLKNVPLSTLCSEYIDNNIPVVFWGTIDMQKPHTWMTWTIEHTDRTHTWINPFHCLLLVGYNRSGYYFNDPWRKKQTFYPRAAVEEAYVGIGMEALVITKRESNEETSAPSDINMFIDDAVDENSAPDTVQ